MGTWACPNRRCHRTPARPVVAPRAAPAGAAHRWRTDGRPAGASGGRPGPPPDTPSAGPG